MTCMNVVLYLYHTFHTFLRQITLVGFIFTVFPLAYNLSMVFSWQWTVFGVTGRNGVLVQSRVLVEFRGEYGAAPIPRLLMVAETVLDRENRHKLAIKMPVQVTCQKLLHH